MSDDKFDVIVVGGGIAGTVASYLLAKEGLSVVLVERGNFCGSKNMTGGRLYAYSLEEVMPGFANEAPVERKVFKERISLLTMDQSVTLDVRSPKFAESGNDSYVVLRSSFDRWLGEKAESEGAMIVAGYRVDDLIVRDDKVCGIISNGEEMDADVVVLADGVNSLLAEKLGMKKPLRPEHVAVGVKEVIQLTRGEIDERFGLSGDEGCAWSFFGANTDGIQGGGFLYTNKDSISIGLTCNLQKLSEGSKPLMQLMNDFQSHPVVAPLVKGGNLIEYSAHLEPEAGAKMIPQLYGNGVLVIGDAAGLTLNLGHKVRGMDLAVISAQCAAQAILEAKSREDFTASSLRKYKDLLDVSSAIQNIEARDKYLEFMENPLLYNAYPLMIVDMLARLFVVKGGRAQTIFDDILKNIEALGKNQIENDFKAVKKL
ncbi:MAG: FAD-dependent oxidoreductase [Synergistaceae bacterium]|jgi:electron transfer flavoprotein-quinone oxidoreductase|nr:FAD-dependent oxidoreductase [Synergistaceae bacterium]